VFGYDRGDRFVRRFVVSSPFQRVVEWLNRFRRRAFLGH
jgi:hypothetical protein